MRLKGYCLLQPEQERQEKREDEFVSDKDSQGGGGRNPLGS